MSFRKKKTCCYLGNAGVGRVYKTDTVTTDDGLTLSTSTYVPLASVQISLPLPGDFGLKESLASGKNLEQTNGMLLPSDPASIEELAGSIVPPSND